MNILAVFFAVLLEQVRPLPQGHVLHRSIQRWLQWSMHHLDANVPVQAWFAWGISVLLPALASYLVHWLLLHFLGWFTAMLWTVAVVYAALGLRTFNQFFVSLRMALENGDDRTARQTLRKAILPEGYVEEVRGSLPKRALLPLALKTSMLLIYRGFFGVLLLFALFAWLGLGPVGAVLFRTTELAWFRWNECNPLYSLDEQASSALQRVSAKAWYIVNWFPSRCTCLLFAAVGNFDSAFAAWRSTFQQVPHDPDAHLIAAMSGAMNLSLRRARALIGKGSTTNWEPDVDGMTKPSSMTIEEPAHDAFLLLKLASLIWRALLLFMTILLMVGMILLVT